ncbi:MAG TPA: DNA-processing protein DprA [Chloroflexota bacterium]|nr:DNA-processing protein DprA [Chloroflexota bacterium]
MSPLDLHLMPAGSAMHADAPFLALLTALPTGALPQAARDAWQRQGAPQPRDLFEWSPEALSEALGVPEQDLEPLIALRARLPEARALVARLAAEGVVAVSTRERAYPRNLREALGADAPPLLWLAGSRDPLSRGPVAVVGERNAPLDAVEIAREVAVVLAREGRSVLTGMATAFERSLLQATLAEPGGAAVAVAHYGIARALPNLHLWRQAVREGRLLLLSPTHPEAPWEPRLEESGGAVLAGLAERMVLVGGGEPAAADRCAWHALRLGRPLFVRSGEDRETTALLAGGAHILVEPVRVDLVLIGMPAARSGAEERRAAPLSGDAEDGPGIAPAPRRPAMKKALTASLSPAEEDSHQIEPLADTPAAKLEADLLRCLTRSSRPVGKGALIRALAVEEAALDHLLPILIGQGRVVQRPHRAGVAYTLTGDAGAATGAFQPSLFGQAEE